MVTTALDPAVAKDRVVLRVYRVHEADDIVFAWYQLRLLVNETQSMQQRRHAAGRVGDIKPLLDPGGDVFGAQEHVAWQRKFMTPVDQDYR